MYFITGFFVLLFLVSFLRDNRSLWNPALLLLSLLFSYMSIANLFYEAGQKEVHMVFFAGIFLLLPLLVFLSGFFLIIEKRRKIQGKLFVSRIRLRDSILFCDHGDSSERYQGLVLHQSSSEYYLFLFDLFVFDFWFCLCRISALFHSVSFHS